MIKFIILRSMIYIVGAVLVYLKGIKSIAFNLFVGFGVALSKGLFSSNVQNFMLIIYILSVSWVIYDVLKGNITKSQKDEK